MASDRATDGGISRPVNKRGMTNSGSCSANSPQRTECGDRRRARNPYDGCCVRTRAISSSTLGKMRCDDDVDARRVGMQAVVLHEVEIGGNAVEEERIEKRRRIWPPAPDRCARRPGRNRRRDSAPRACRTAGPRCDARSAGCRIASSASRVTSGLMPRSMSLAPSSTMTASVPCGTDQSSRASPSDAVSPETPALAISAAMPLAASAACRRGTKPSLSGRP